MTEQSTYVPILCGQLRKWILESPTDAKSFMVVHVGAEDESFDQRITVLERGRTIVYSRAVILYQSKILREEAK
jgi:hypothetical protein